MIYCIAYERQPCKDTICCRRCETFEKFWRRKCFNNPEVCGKSCSHEKNGGSDNHEEAV